MLPKRVKKIISAEEDRMNSYDKNEIKQKMLMQGVYTEAEIDALFNKDNIVQSVKNIMDELDIEVDTCFFEFYSKIGFPPLGNGSALYTLYQILEDSENPFWEDECPNLSKRYLQISSIEGQGSYFYDKETDVVYDVGWEDMDRFAKGELEPQWKSFYDFLEWYYSDEEEK